MVARVPGARSQENPRAYWISDTINNGRPLLSNFAFQLQHCPPKKRMGFEQYPTNCFKHCSSFMTLNTFEPINLVSLGSSPPLLRPPIVPLLVPSSSSISSSSSSPSSLLLTMAMPPVILLLRLPTGPGHLKAIKCISNTLQKFESLPWRIDCYLMIPVLLV